MGWDGTDGTQKMYDFRTSGSGESSNFLKGEFFRTQLRTFW